MNVGDVVFEPAKYPPEPPDGTTVQLVRLGHHPTGSNLVTVRLIRVDSAAGEPRWHEDYDMLHGLRWSGLLWQQLCEMAEGSREPIVVVEPALSEASCPQCAHPMTSVELRRMLDQVAVARRGRQSGETPVP